METDNRWLLFATYLFYFTRIYPGSIRELKYRIDTRMLEYNKYLVNTNNLHFSGTVERIRPVKFGCVHRFGNWSTLGEMIGIFLISRVSLRRRLYGDTLYIRRYGSALSNISGRATLSPVKPIGSPQRERGEVQIAGQFIGSPWC